MFETHQRGARELIPYACQIIKPSTHKNRQARKAKNDLLLDEKIAMVADKGPFHVELPIGAKVASRVSKKQKECDEVENAYLELESKENKYARKRNLKDRSVRFDEENAKLEEQMALTDEFRQMNDLEKFTD